MFAATQEQRKTLASRDPPELTPSFFAARLQLATVESDVVVVVDLTAINHPDGVSASNVGVEVNVALVGVVIIGGYASPKGVINIDIKVGGGVAVNGHGNGFAATKVTSESVDAVSGETVAAAFIGVVSVKGSDGTGL